MAAFVTPDPGKPHREVAAVQVFKTTVMTYVHQKPKRESESTARIYGKTVAP